jgi:hypothetical protein
MRRARQYAIFLSGGEMEVVIGDGTTRHAPDHSIFSKNRYGQFRDDLLRRLFEMSQGASAQAPNHKAGH